MLENRDSPRSIDRLADELKAAVLVAMIGLVALGVSDLFALNHAPIARDAGPTREAPAVSDGYVPPGQESAEATNGAPDAPVR
jgi:hypothetical protein